MTMMKNNILLKALHHSPNKQATATFDSELLLTMSIGLVALIGSMTLVRVLFGHGGV